MALPAGTYTSVKGTAAAPDGAPSVIKLRVLHASSIGLGLLPSDSVSSCFIRYDIHFPLSTRGVHGCRIQIGNNTEFVTSSILNCEVHSSRVRK